MTEPAASKDDPDRFFADLLADLPAADLPTDLLADLPAADLPADLLADLPADLLAVDFRAAEGFLPRDEADLEVRFELGRDGLLERCEVATVPLTLPAG